MPGFTCCVPECFNNNKRERHLRFYEFPKGKNLRKLWINKVSRRGKKGKFSLFVPSTGHRVCSDHFEGGKKTYTVRIPTIFPWRKTKTNTPRRQLVRKPVPSECGKRNSDESDINVKDVSVDHSYAVASNSPDHLLLKIREKDQIIYDLESKIEELESKILSLKNEAEQMRKNYDNVLLEVSTLQRKNTLAIAELDQTKRELNSKTFSFQSIKDKPDIVKFYTGFSSHSEFLSLYNFLSPDFSCINYWGSKEKITSSERPRHHKITPEDQLLLVLSRLRVGLLEEDLAYR
jgi:hypothetical protein